MRNPFQESAMRYAAKGLPVFPLLPNTKRPATKHGLLDATTDLQQVEAWSTEYPDANIGMRMGKSSGLLALDFDCKDGKPGLQTLQSLRARFDIETLEAKTPSGGVHLFFKYPGAMLKNNVERLPGLDIRTDGGYVAIAPSVVDGRAYAWVKATPPAEMPADLIAKLNKPDRKISSIRPRTLPYTRLQIIERARRYVIATPGAVEGQSGDVRTYKLACTLVRGFALSDDEALMLLTTWNQRCQPSWTEQELVTKIVSARRNGTETFGARLERTR